MILFTNVWDETQKFIFKESSCVTATRAASAALEAVLMNFFHIFGLIPTSLVLRNFPVLKNSRNTNCLLIVCYSLKGGLSCSRGCTDELFPFFLAETH